MPLIYQELHRIAVGYLRRESPDHTLQPTALVHEADLRLADYNDASYESRRHFFVVAARTMRRVLVDHARARCAMKRGRGLMVALDPRTEAAAERDSIVIGVDHALDSLAREDESKARLVEMRFFAGLSCGGDLGNHRNAGARRAPRAAQRSSLAAPSNGSVKSEDRQAPRSGGVGCAAPPRGRPGGTLFRSGAAGGSLRPAALRRRSGALVRPRDSGGRGISPRRRTCDVSRRCDRLLQARLRHRTRRHGSVYRAERADGEVQQTVALKLLRADACRAGWRERFLNERQLLATLQHPSIVRLLDAGHNGAMAGPIW